eukprot:278455-Chlamydomonas_euryale.AAC.1
MLSTSTAACPRLATPFHARWSGSYRRATHHSDAARATNPRDAHAGARHIQPTGKHAHARRRPMTPGTGQRQRAQRQACFVIRRSSSSTQEAKPAAPRPPTTDTIKTAAQSTPPPPPPTRSLPDTAAHARRSPAADPAAPPDAA